MGTLYVAYMYNVCTLYNIVVRTWVLSAFLPMQKF